MTEETYQNQDLDNLNPLQTKEDIQIINEKFKLFGVSIPQDPKIKILLVLGTILLLLLIISAFSTLAKRTPRPPARVSPTPTPNITPLPTEIADTTNIPDETRTKFKEIDKNIDTTINFNPPQIDIEVGL